MCVCYGDTINLKSCTEDTVPLEKISSDDIVMALVVY